MITVQYTVPTHNTVGTFINDPIKVSFSQTIESSYFTTEYFMLYRTNDDYTGYYEQVDLTISYVDEYINVQPRIYLNPNTSYLMMVVGGETGIESTTNDTLQENLILHFKTGDSARVTNAPVTITPSVNTFTEGSVPGVSTVKPSTDLFSLSGENAAIGVVSTTPSDLSLGIDGLERIIVKFNDRIANSTIPVNTLTGRYAGLPHDMDPFAANEIIPTSVEVSNNLAIFTIPLLSGETNREYSFKVAPDIVQGTTRRQAMQEPYEFRFYSKLSPLYATPDQIITRLKAFNENAKVNVSRADIYKLILEQSLYALEKYKFTVTPELLPIINRLIICMVLRDMLLSGYVMMPNIKSRTLIATKVEYYNMNTDDAKDALNDCIKDALDELTGGHASTISTGIKSGNRMTRPTKEYQVYR